jgi:hypothetical protein
VQHHKKLTEVILHVLQLWTNETTFFKIISHCNTV